MKPPEACAATNDTSGGFTPEATGPDKNFRALTPRHTEFANRWWAARVQTQVAWRSRPAGRSRSRQPRSGFWRAMARLVRLLFFALSEVHIVNRRAELADRQSSQVFLAHDALLGAMHDQRDRDRQDLHRFLSAAHR